MNKDHILRDVWGRRRRRDQKLILRLLTGNCTGEDEDEARARISTDECFAEAFGEVQRVWEVAADREPEVDVDAFLLRLHRRAEPRARITPLPSASSRVGRSPSPRPSRRGGAQRMWAAALIAGAALLVAIALHGAQPEAPVAAPQPRVYTTQKGQRAALTLADGTKVKLNVDSELTLPSEFAMDRREVRLKGEAYLEVAPDSRRPFVIHTEEATVRVVGTAFGMRAYTDESNTQVVVTEGLVSVTASNRSAADTVLLRPRDHAVFATDRPPVLQQDVAPERYLTWTEGRLVFDDAPFDEVVRALERWYDLDIVVTFPPETVVGLNASFDDEPLSAILNTVSVALGLRYERDLRTITFHRGAK